MSDLSAYEKQRLKNIRENQEKLAELGLVGTTLCAKPEENSNKPPKRKQDDVLPTDVLPTRESSRLAGKDPVNYSDFDLDAQERELEKKRRQKVQGKRESNQPNRYTDASYNKRAYNKRARNATQNATHVVNPNSSRSHYAALSGVDSMVGAKPLPRDSTQLQSEMERLFKSGFTKEHLYEADYPVDYQAKYQVYEDEQRRRGFSFEPHPYKLAPYEATNYKSINPRVICPTCQQPWVMTADLQLRKHNCIPIGQS